MRSLAQRTQASTAEISKMIEVLQGAYRRAGSAMQLSRQQMQESVELAREAGSSIDSINGAVTQITDMNTLIATATRDSRTRSPRSSIAASSDPPPPPTRNAQGAQQTAQACVELSRLATSLHHMTRRFTLLLLVTRHSAEGPNRRNAVHLSGAALRFTGKRVFDIFTAWVSMAWGVF